jgi:uncharacterized protein YodC (DUF2158 family)
MSDLKVGDLVVLKSGGPLMTVTETPKPTDDDVDRNLASVYPKVGCVVCEWFGFREDWGLCWGLSAQKERLIRQQFPVDALRTP